MDVTVAANRVVSTCKIDFWKLASLLLSPAEQLDAESVTMRSTFPTQEGHLLERGVKNNRGIIIDLGDIWGENTCASHTSLSAACQHELIHQAMLEMLNHSQACYLGNKPCMAEEICCGREKMRILSRGFDTLKVIGRPSKSCTGFTNTTRSHPGCNKEALTWTVTWNRGYSSK